MRYRQWEITFSELSDLQRAGLKYWQNLPQYAQSGMPLGSTFDLMKVPPGILRTTHVVDVLNEGREFRYRFWGSGFRDYLGYDGTGMSTDTLMPVEIREPVRNAYAEVVQTRTPLAMISEFARGREQPRQGFQRFIRLPLVNDKSDVIQIVSLVEFLMEDHKAQELIDTINRQSS